MSRFPVVNIYKLVYFQNGKGGRDGEGLSPLVYRGENVAQQFLTVFKYTYEVNGADSGILVLTFPFYNLDLTEINKGTFLYVEWGYAGEPLIGREVAVEELKLQQDANACRLTLELLSVTEFLEKNPMWASTVGDGLKEKGVSLEYTFDNPQDGTRQTVTVNPDESTVKVSGIHKDRPHLRNPVPPSQPPWWDVFQKDLEARKEAEKLARDTTLYIEQPYDPRVNVWLPAGVTIRNNQPSGLLTLNKEYADQRLSEIIMVWLTKFSSGGLLSLRDRNIIAADIPLDEAPSFSFSIDPIEGFRGVISFRIEQPTTPYEVETTITVSVDPLTKTTLLGQVKVGEDLPEDTQELPVKVGAYEFTDVKFGGSAETPIVEYKNSLYFDMGEGSLQRLDEDQERGFTYTRELQAFYGSRAFDKEGYIRDEYMDGSKLQKDRDRVKWEKYIVFTNDNPNNLAIRRPDEYLEEFMTLKINVKGPEGLIQARNELLYDYYKTMGCTLVSEGDPEMLVGFNFTVMRSGSYLDGVYFCVENEHHIMAGKYTISLKGARLPETIQVQESLSEMAPDPRLLYKDHIAKANSVVREVMSAVGVSDFAGINYNIHRLPRPIRSPHLSRRLRLSDYDPHPMGGPILGTARNAAAREDRGFGLLRDRGYIIMTEIEVTTGPSHNNINSLDRSKLNKALETDVGED